MTNLIGQRLGNYEITSRLGEGGMASVYRARQLNIKREVAIKVILPNLAIREDFNRRFEQEAQIIASLSNPHIVKVFDYGVLRGFHLRLIDSMADKNKDLYYFVMELLTGGSLANRMNKGPIPVENVVSILEQTALALDYAHGRGLIHRDLKPPNVLFDDQENAFLTDFGIAKLISGEGASLPPLTQEGMTMGTPSYMAPEQWTDEKIGPASDLYALGVVLFEMLTGKLPFVAGTPFRVMHMHLNDAPPSLYSLNKNLPPNLDPVIQTALAKDPKARFESAVAMSNALKMALAKNKAAEVVPPPPPQQPAPEVKPAAPEPTPSPLPIAPKASVPTDAGTVSLDRRVVFGGLVLFALLVIIIVLLAGRG